LDVRRSGVIPQGRGVLAGAIEEAELEHEQRPEVAHVLDGLHEPRPEQVPPGLCRRDQRPLGADLAALGPDHFSQPLRLQRRQRAVDQGARQRPDATHLTVGTEGLADREAVTRLLRDQAQHGPLTGRKRHLAHSSTLAARGDGEAVSACGPPPLFTCNPADFEGLDSLIDIVPVDPE